MINIQRVTRLTIILFIGLSLSALGQEKAKIAGKVTDAATKEALPSVNVTIEGTTYGAASDVNGDYFIVNLAPGTYTVVASIIGYSKVRVENVAVNTGRTTIINIPM